MGKVASKYETHKAWANAEQQTKLKMGDNIISSSREEEVSVSSLGSSRLMI